MKSYVMTLLLLLAPSLALAENGTDIAVIPVVAAESDKKDFNNFLGALYQQWCDPFSGICYDQFGRPIAKPGMTFQQAAPVAESAVCDCGCENCSCATTSTVAGSMPPVIVQGAPKTSFSYYASNVCPDCGGVHGLMSYQYQSANNNRMRLIDRWRMRRANRLLKLATGN